MANVFDRYRNWKDQKTATGTSSGGSGKYEKNATGVSGGRMMDRYKSWRAEKYGSQIASEMQNRLKTWMDEHNSFVKSYSDRFGGRNGDYSTQNYVADAKDWYDSATARGNTLAATANQLLEDLRRDSYIYGNDYVKEVTNMLTSGRSLYANIANIARGDVDFWGQFTPTEQQKAAGYDTAEKVYQEWQKDNKYRTKHEGKNRDEINRSILYAEDEQEADWLRQRATELWTSADEQARADRIEAERQKLYNVGGGDYFTPQEQRRMHYLVDAADDARSETERLKYKELANNVDFAEKSVVDMQGNSGPDDSLYRYVNDQYARALAKAQPSFSYGGQIARKGYDKMRPEEVATFNYLYHTEGRESAQNYLDSMEGELSARRQEENTAKWQTVAQKHPVLADAVSVGGSLLGGIGFIDAIDQKVTNDLKGNYYRPINYNSDAMTPSIVSSAIRKERSQQWAEGTKGVLDFLGVENENGVIAIDSAKHPLLSRLFNGRSAGDAYQLGMSMIDSFTAGKLAPIIGVGGSSLLLAGNAATQTTLEKAAGGATDGQALTMGLLAGAFEFLFEKYEIEHLLGADTNVLRKMGNQAITEGLGEGATSFANTVADILVMAEQSDLSKSAAEYQRKHPEWSEKQCLQQALLDSAVNIGWDMVGGALTGSIMGGTESVLQNIVERVDRSAQQNSQWREDYGQSQKELVAEALEIDPANAYAQKMQALLDKGKDLSGKQLGRLVEQNSNATAAEMMPALREAVENRLKSMGETGDVSVLTDALIKNFSGAKLTAAETSRIANSRNAAAVAEDLAAANNPRTPTPNWLADSFDAIPVVEAPEIATSHAAPRNDNRKNASPVARTVGSEDVSAEQPRGLARTQKVTRAAQKAGKVATVADYAAAYGEHGPAMEQVYNMEDASQDAQQFASGYEVAYNWGYSGVRPEYLSRDDTRGYTGILTEAQRQRAYQNGLAAAKADNKTPINPNKFIGTNRENWRPGKVSAVGTTAGGEALTVAHIDKAFGADVRGSVVNYLRSAAEITGVDVVLFESHEVDGKMVGPVIMDGGKRVDLRNSDGGFSWDNNKIYIDINAGARDGLTAKEVMKNTMFYTFGHEFTHFCEKWNAEEYLQFREFVFQYMDEKMAREYSAGSSQFRNVHELINARMDYEGADYDYSAREVVADALAKILPESQFIQELAKKKQNWAQKLMDAIKQFVADIKAALKGSDLTESAPHVDIRENIDGSLQYLEEIRQMYDKLAAGAVENYQAAMETTAETDAQAQKNTTQEGSVSRKARMTDAEIQAVQGIGRISVNQFSSADIKATERFAQQYWKEMGVKSPFFRAWFGDWRVNDQAKVQVATQNGDARGVQKNADTGWDIQVSGKVFDETKRHTESYNIAARKYLPYINSIVKNAVLLDSYGIDPKKPKSHNSLLMHSLYAVADTGNGPEIIKLYVEEMNDPNNENTLKRSYQLQNVEKYQLQNGSSHKNASSISSATGNIITVADLFAAVKQKDSAFQPKPASKVVNPDGTPMVVYHGTSDQFTEFKHSELSDKEGSFFFAQNREDAEAYTGNGNVMEAYVNLQNPIDYNDMPSEIYKLKDKKSQVAALRKLGYDGWVCDMDTGWGEVSAFNSNQIKSATDNIGTFDGNNADIRYKKKRHSVSKPVKVSELGIERKFVAYDDLRAIDVAISATVRDLVAKGQTVAITPEDVSGHIQIAEANEISVARSLLKNILRQFLGKSVYFNHHGNYAEAYLTKDGLNHSAGGKITPERAAVVEKFNELVSKSEYSYSSKNDVHSKINQKIQGGIDWDCFVAVAMVDDAPYPIVFKIRTTTLDPRSQIYEIFAKKEIGSSHDGIQQKNLPDALPNYGGTPISDTTITQPETNVKDETATKVSNKKRGTTLSDREVLEVAALRMDTSTLTEGEKTALDIFKNRLEEMRKLQIERERLGSLWHEQQFGSGDRSEAPKTLNRMQVLDGQIERAVNSVLSVEDKQILRDVLQKAREYVKEQSVDHYRGILERRKDRSTQAQLRQKLHSTVHELSQLLLHGDKNHHVPESMKKAVAGALDVINSLDARKTAAQIAALDNRIMELLQQKQAITQQMTDENSEALSKKLLSLEGEIQQLQKRKESAGRLQDKLAELSAAYAEIGKGADPDFVYAYDLTVADAIQGAVEKIGDTDLKDMSTEQLEALCNAYKMLRAAVRNSNRSFTQGKNATMDALIRSTINEVKNAGGVHDTLPAATAGVRKYLWDNLKPVYAMEKIGSNTFTDVFWSLIEGEGVYAGDVADASRFAERLEEKYGYKKWDFKKKYSFTSTAGTEFDLTLEQIMSLYAYAKRGDQALEHLRLGGFVFDSNIEVYDKDGKQLKEYDPRKLWNKALKYKVNTAKAHQLSAEIVGEIVAVLDDMPDVKAFVDKMQAYLSDTMGAKGNEVSMAMYDVALFKEKFYFPLKSAKQYMHEQNEVAGEVRIKNSGFTNKLTPGANNPVILNNFMDVWANHVHDMSMYHSFVLPIEDFNRIFNGKTRQAEGIEAVSVKATLQEAYGPEAVNYLRQLITDLNGGARSDPRESTGKVLMSRFKKAAVMGSASVVIQQPSAMIRARALIDEKYFNHINPKLLSHNKLWEELKKYAPVAVIKEMGRFDMDTGRGTVDYIKNEKTIMDKVDDVLSVAPAKADEWAWIQIWEAVKRETAVKNPTMKTGSEEFLKKAGRRFTEVIVKTQVYDSTLSRSANMRSKSALMNMVTSFMAEPTTSINMLEQGVREWKRGNKKAAFRHFTAVYGSVLVNSLLVSIVYAMRDDDEDETFLEKYFSSATTEPIDGINPLTYLPWIKDAWSILQGFDVERSDMSLVNDAGEALTTLVKTLSKDTEDMSEDELAENNKAVAEAWFGVAEVVTNLLGVPVKNVRRDAMGMINTITTLKTDFTERGLANWEYMKDQLGEAAKDSLPVVGWLPDKSATDKLYDAIISGNDSYRARIEATFKRDTEAKTNTAIKNAVRKALKENDPRITQMAEAYLDGDFDTVMDLYEQIHSEGHFVHDTIKAAYKSRIGELEKKHGLEDEAEYTPDGDTADTLYDAEAYYEAVAGGDSESAAFVKNDMLDYMDETDFNSKFRSTVKNHYEDGDLSGDEAEQMLTKHGGHSAQEAWEYVRYWDFKEEYPELELSKAAVNKYYDGYYKDGKQVCKGAESFDISLDVYAQYCERKAGYSKKEDIMKVIDELSLTVKQKDALYYLNGWAKSTIGDAPWH